VTFHPCDKRIQDGQLTKRAGDWQLNDSKENVGLYFFIAMESSLKAVEGHRSPGR
jgi:hypothetical protein